MEIDVGDLTPLDEATRLRRYADGFFRDNYLWIQVRAIAFCNRHVRYSIEDALTEAWMRLPSILSKYDHERSAIKTFCSRQFKWYWLRHCYKDICKDEKLDRFAYLKEYSEPLESGEADIGLDTVDNEDERQFIVSKIKNVDKKAQVILTLRYINGMTMDEIAVFLGCAKSMVHVYCHKALEQIRPILKQTSYGCSSETHTTVLPNANGKSRQ